MIRVDWDHGSGDNFRYYSGEFVAIVPKGEDAWSLLPPDATNGNKVITKRVHFDMFNERANRMIVKVKRESGVGFDYYAPNVKWVRFV
jgi:hypothetical protein